MSVVSVENLSTIYGKAMDKRRNTRDSKLGLTKSDILQNGENIESERFLFLRDAIKDNLLFFVDLTFQGHAVQWSKGVLTQFDCTTTAPDFTTSTVQNIIPDEWHQSLLHERENRFTLDSDFNLADPRSMMAILLSTLISKNPGIRGGAEEIAWINQFQNINYKKAIDIFKQFEDSPVLGTSDVTMLYKINEDTYGVDFFGNHARHELTTSVIINRRPSNFTLVHTEWNNKDVALRMFEEFSSGEYWLSLNSAVDIICSEQFEAGKLNSVTKLENLNLKPDLDGKLYRDKSSFSLANTHMLYPPINLLHTDHRHHYPSAYNYSVKIGNCEIVAEDMTSFKEQVERAGKEFRYFEGWTADPILKPTIKYNFIENTALVRK